MKKRIGAVLLAVCLALTLVPTAWAEEKDVLISGLDGTNSEYTFDEAKLRILEAYYSDAGINQDYTVTLLGDREVELDNTYDESNPISVLTYGFAMLLMGCQDEATATFDLGGHTLTVTAKEGFQVFEDLGGMGGGVMATGGNSLVTNGTIIVGTTGLGGVLGFDGKALRVENVAVRAADGVTGVFGICNNLREAGKLNTTIVQNCTVSLGKGSTALYCPGGGHDGNGVIHTYDIFVKSGSFDTFPAGDDATFVSLFDEKSEKMSEEDTAKLGVTGTVVTSPDTTAIIVKDGNAYLYDSLQDAVDAAKDKQGGAGGAVQISLLKQPEDATVVLPDGVELTIKPLDDADDSIKTEDIQLETSDGKKAEIGTNGEVMVQAVPVQSVTLNKPTLSLAVGGSEALAATVLPADAADKTIAWTSSDETIATVDAAGTVTAVAEGTATITATAGGKTASCVVTVSPAAIPVTGVTLDKPALSLAVGERGTLTATVSPENAADTVAWSSDNGAVATVDQNGVVTAVSAGTAQITATAGGQSASCTVTVTFPYIPVIPTQPTQPTKPTQPDTPDEPDTPVVPAVSYADVSANDWFYDEVSYVTAKGLMTGTTATTFAPNATTTRAMVWTILGRMTGAEVDGGEPWYSLAQTWAVSEGVSDGTNPNGPITREELAVMLYRYAGSPAVGLSELANLGQFTDGETVSDWAQEAMAWAVSNGVISGSGSAILPQQSATRAQVAAMLMRLCETMDK